MYTYLKQSRKQDVRFNVGKALHNWHIDINHRRRLQSTLHGNLLSDKSTYTVYKAQGDLYTSTLVC